MPTIQIQLKSTDTQSIDFTNGNIVDTITHKKVHNELPVIPEMENENSGPLSINHFGSRPVDDSEEENESKSHSFHEVSNKAMNYEIDQKICQVCKVEQPLRAKHCRECGHCIGLFDHHCPWIGTCIGEKNRLYFWWYLFFECVLINWTLINCIQSIYYTSDFWFFIRCNAVLCIIISLSGLFGLLVTFLLILHTYLVMTNKTTWEFLSWGKISYLEKWPKTAGSPFNRGPIKNLHYFCCQSLSKNLTIWSFPLQSV